MNEPMMLKEIREQPDALERTLRLEGKNVVAIARRIAAMKPRFIMLVARGTSDNAAMYAKYLFEGMNGMPSLLAAPSIITVYKSELDLAGSVVLGISQSGAGTDINEVLSFARSRGAFTVGMTNTAGSDMTRAADAAILLRAGKERALAATKTYTSELLALMMLSAGLRGGADPFTRLECIPEKLEKTLAVEQRVREIAPRFRFMEHCVIIGRGYNYGTVREAALKLMETGYVVAQPFSTADFMHGPIAMTGAGFPVFVCAPGGRLTAPVRALTEDLTANGVETIAVSADRATLKHAAVPVHIPMSPPEYISPILYIVPFQYLACFISLTKGINPDNPRYLKKVTRTL